MPTDRRIPPLVHFVYALRRNATFEFAQFAAVRSALAVHQPAMAFFHYTHEPRGLFWQAVRPSLELVQHDADTLSRGEGGRCLKHYAHMADLLRLRALARHGGLYLDMDTISLQPLPPRLRESAEFVIAWQMPPGVRNVTPPCTQTGSSPSSSSSWACGGSAHERAHSRGLCNAIMASAPDSAFGSHWLRSYSRFRSRGRDSLWDEHSVGLPARMYERCGSEIRQSVTALPPASFFPFYWLEAPTLLTSPWSERIAHRLRSTLVVHLWYGSSASARRRRHGSASFQLSARLRRGAAVSARRGLRDSVVPSTVLSGGTAHTDEPQPISHENHGPPRSPDEPCTPEYARTTIGHLSCRYAGVSGRAMKAS